MGEINTVLKHYTFYQYWFYHHRPLIPLLKNKKLHNKHEFKQNKCKRKSILSFSSLRDCSSLFNIIIILGILIMLSILSSMFVLLRIFPQNACRIGPYVQQCSALKLRNMTTVLVDYVSYSILLPQTQTQLSLYLCGK